MVKSDAPNDDYPMDTWGESTTPNMTSQTQLPASGMKRAFRKPQNKFRWYIIIGITVLITLVVVVVISLAIHFTRNSDNPKTFTAAQIEDGPDTDQPGAVNPLTSSTAMESGDGLSSNIAIQPSPITSTFSTDSRVNTTSDLGEVTPNSATLSTIITPSNPRLTLMASDLTVKRMKLTLTCEAIYMTGWSDLHIIRHDTDVKETVGIVTAGFQYPSVSVLDPDFSSQISYKDDAVAFVLESDVPYCTGATNYSCVVRAIPGTFTAFTQVKVKQLEPSVIVPKSVVAERNITLQCFADIHGQSGTIKWKIRPPGMPSFYDLSTSPVTSQTFYNCSTSINSTLVFVPKASDNGSQFRCVIEGSDGAIEKDDYPKTDVEFTVIPDTFCADKAAYTIHTHPYSPCNLVIYCFQTGPFVYEINCDPGTCYDKDNTKCV